MYCIIQTAFKLPFHWYQSLF